MKMSMVTFVRRSRCWVLGELSECQLRQRRGPEAPPARVCVRRAGRPGGAPARDPAPRSGLTFGSSTCR